MNVSHLQEQQLLWCDGVSSLYRREQDRGTQRYGAHYMTHLQMPMKIIGLRALALAMTVEAIQGHKACLLQLLAH